MTRFVVDRLVRLVLVLFAITVASFLFLHLIPGNPATIRLGEHASPAEVQALTKALGLDRPWYVQLGVYLERLAHGDLGTSIADSQPVGQKLAAYFPATVELTVAALAVAVAIGIPAGVAAATRAGGTLDTLVMAFVLLGVSIPVFWLGWLLVYAFAVAPLGWGIDWFPISGQISLYYRIPPVTHFVLLDALLAGNLAAAGDAVRHLVLPALTLATIPLAITAKITRSGMLEVLRADYVRTARAKGLGSAAVTVRHALRNALIPIVTVVGLQTGLLLGGAVLTEHIFAWPGVGRLAYDAISNRDMPLINGCILLFAAVFVSVNTAVDLLYAALNPRIRYA